MDKCGWYTSSIGYTSNIALMQPAIHCIQTTLSSSKLKDNNLFSLYSIFMNRKRQHGNPPPPNPKTQKKHNLIKLSPMQSNLQPNHLNEHLIRSQTGQ